ncbi:hypothetical protein BBJ28_00021751 [Nothophytophthora sp. Chile5]|nr:hypothetical protein BBJ28_00021751 [Nothophytophthora sp. Chile5]
MQSLGERKGFNSERKPPDKIGKMETTVATLTKESEQDQELKRQELDMRRLELEEHRLEREEASRWHDEEWKGRLHLAELERDKTLARNAARNDNSNK